MSDRMLAVALLAAGCALQAEEPAAPARQEAPVKAPRQVVPFAAGEDPFRALAPPSFATGPAPTGPQTDTLRLGPTAPPRAGEQELPFPPPLPARAPAATPAPPLEIARTQPAGDEELVGAVLARFNQPMVPLASVGDLKQAESPLHVTPEPPGRYRWLDASTVVFEPVDRMPFATVYRAEVRQGATSALGQKLAKATSWQFRTPRPQLLQMQPYENSEQARPEDVLKLLFNAKVDPATVAKFVTLREDGKQKIELQVLPTDVPPASAHPAAVLDAAWERARSVVLQPARPLVPGRSYEVLLSKDLVCAEGPLPMGAARTVKFATYKPLKVTRIACNWNDEPCHPGSPIRIETNNPLPAQKLDALVQAEPKVEDFQARALGAGIQITGEFLPSTTYAVKVLAGLKDVYGQTLAKAATGKVKYGEAEPFVALARTGIVALEAAFPPAMPVVAMNAGKATWRAAPVPEEKLLDAALRLRQGTSGDDDPLAGLKTAVAKEIDLSPQKNAATRLSLDLAGALGKGGRGLVALDLRPHKPIYEWGPRHYFALAQVTDLGITAAMSDDRLFAMVATLGKGAPVAGATVRLVGASGKLAEAKTDADGLASLPGPVPLKKSGPFVLVAEAQGDKAFLLLDGRVDAGEWMSSYSYSLPSHPPATLEGLAFSERGIYRPAEKVFLSVIARQKRFGPAGDTEPLPAEARRLDYRVNDPQGRELQKGTLELTPFGTGSLELTTAGDAPLGTWHASFSSPQLPGGIHGTFELREYRTPEYKVSVEHDAQGRPMLLGAATEAVVRGSYYFGAPMAGAAVQWRVERARSSYTPPGNDGFSFDDFEGDGPWPFFGGGRSRRGGYHPGHWGPPPAMQIDQGEGQLDAQGRLVVPVKLEAGDVTRGPATFTVEADVVDVNRQSISGRTSVLAHRATRYVGLRLEKSVVQAGESLAAQVVVTGLDGARVAGAAATLTLYQVKWETKSSGEGDSYTENTERVEKAVGSCEAKSAAAPAPCGIKVPEPGSYILRALVKDPDGRENGAAVRLWAYGPGLASWRPPGEVKVDLVPDRKEYKAGDKAKVLVQSPFAKARGLVVVSREGFAEVRPFVAESAGSVFELTLKEEWIPSISVRVLLARGRDAEPDAGPDDRGRPMFAAGEIDLEIDRAARRVGVEIEPSARQLDPASEMTISLRTTDAGGKPIAANVALAVVDEGVLSLIAYETPNPLLALYQARQGLTGTMDLRPLVLPREKPALKAQAAPGGMKDAGRGMARSKMMAMPPPMAAPVAMAEMAADKAEGGGEAAPAFQVRAFFASTAYFNGAVQTGPDGRASVKAKLPDNLTEFRIMAIAADAGRRAGSADTQIRVRKPLLVRPALPRFLNLGDKFEAAVVVNNETGFDTEIDVLARAVNAKVLKERAHVPIKAGEAKEVRFPAEAGVPGPAKFQFAAVALTKSRATDAAEIVLPTLIPATAEAFATYGTTETAARQPVSPPKNVFPGFGGLDVDLSSTALTGLQDAVGYLVDYPFECAEQTTSRILPMIALREILPQFRLGSVADETKRAALVKEGVGRLVRQQRGDGGWGFWAASERSWLYLSAYVTLGLQVAKAGGAEVPEGTLERALAFLEQRLDKPADEWEAKDHASQAMAVLVLSRAARTPKAHLARLTTSKGLPMFARAWLFEAWGRFQPKAREGAELYRQLSNAAVETAGSLHFAEGKTESLRLLMHSDDRTDGIVLGALMAVRPDDPMVEKLVRGLMRARTRGRWSTTQANAYALLALREYFVRYEKAVPKFDARVWYGQDYVAGRRFEGREMTIATTRVAMEKLLSAGAADVVVGKEGPGRLYWRLGLRYAPADLKLAPEEQGFAVSRAYLRADKDEPLPRRADGAWIAKAGTDVRVRLQVVVPDRRYWVAVVSPLPAGLEAVDTTLATSSRAVREGNLQRSWDTGPGWWWRWWRPWNHEELRDDRAQIFADQLGAGVYDYTYTARATTPGTFVVPPTRAEEMYAPETFGRSETALMVVEP